MIKFNYIYILFLIIGCSTNQEDIYKGKLFAHKGFNSDLYGFVDTIGNFIIFPKFYRVSNFQNHDTSWVWIENENNEIRGGLIDRNGNWVLEPNISRIHNGSGFKTIEIIKETDTTYSFIDANFSITKLPHLKYVSEINNDGFARAVDSTGKVGIISSTGKWTCPPIYEKLGRIGKEPIFAVLENKYGYIDYFGKTVIPFEYDTDKKGKVENFNGFAKFAFTIAKKNNSYFLIDTFGKKVFPYEFSDFENLSDGNGKFIAVKYNNKWGIASNSKNWIIEPSLDSLIQCFFFQSSDTLKAVKGIINGKEVIVDNQNYKNEIFYHNDYIGTFQNLPIKFLFDNNYYFKVQMIYKDTVFDVGGMLDNVPFENRLISFTLQNEDTKKKIEVSGQFSKNYNSFSGKIKIGNRKQANFIVKKTIEYKRTYKNQYFLEIHRPVFTDKSNSILKKYQRIIDNELKKLEKLHLKENDSFKDENYYKSLKGEALLSVQSIISIDVRFVSNKAFSIVTNKSYLRWTDQEIQNYIILNGKITPFKLEKFIKPSFNIDWLYCSMSGELITYGKPDFDNSNFSLSLKEFESFNFSLKGLAIDFTYEELDRRREFSEYREGNEGNIIQYETLKPFIKPSIFDYLNSEHKQFW